MLEATTPPLPRQSDGELHIPSAAAQSLRNLVGQFVTVPLHVMLVAVVTLHGKGGASEHLTVWAVEFALRNFLARLTLLHILNITCTANRCHEQCRRERIAQLSCRHGDPSIKRSKAPGSTRPSRTIPMHSLCAPYPRRAWLQRAKTAAKCVRYLLSVATCDLFTGDVAPTVGQLPRYFR